MKSFLTKGILNDGEVTINKVLEVPFNLEFDLLKTEVSLEIEKEINIIIEVC
jgi:hypothetical protein